MNMIILAELLKAKRTTIQMIRKALKTTERECIEHNGKHYYIIGEYEGTIKNIKEQLNIYFQNNANDTEWNYWYNLNK